MQRILKTPAIFSGFSPKVDRSMSYRFVGTLEYTKDESDLVFEILNQEGWLMFIPNAESTDEIPIPEEDAPTDKDIKTPSERLRGVKYAYFIQQGGEKSKFNRWYMAWKDKWIEKEIDLTKEKLNG